MLLFEEFYRFNFSIQSPKSQEKADREKIFAVGFMKMCIS